MLSISYLKTELLKRLKSFIEKNSLINGKNIGAAVSGGPDSVFMLHFLNLLAKQINLSITVLHFNHKIRKEADDDENFTKRLAEGMRLNFISEQCEVKVFANRNKLSLEDAARKKRYEFFAKYKKKLNLDAIALAHTKNDLVETFLMNMLRGSSIDGLTSLKSKREFYIRPVLFLTKHEILDYLNNEHITFKIDETNKSTDFLRNKIRLELIDTLKEYNPNIIDTIYKEYEIFRQDSKYLEEKAQEAVIKLVKFHEARASVDITQVKSIAIKRRVISEVCKRVLNSSYSLSFDNIERIANIKNPDKIVHLRKVLKAYLKNNKLIIEKI